MSKFQYATLENFQEFAEFNKAWTNSKISDNVKNSIKTVSQSDDGYTLYFYTKTAPVTIEDAVFTITLPAPIGKADKVKNAVEGHIAGLDANGNLVDSGKAVTDFDAAGAADSAKAEVMGYVGTIPADANAKDVVAYIKEAVTAGRYDDSQVKADIAANKGAIDTLNGKGEGSVWKTVIDQMQTIIAGAPENRDSFKELSDWIDSHTSDAATMNSQIKTNKEDIANLKTIIGTLPDTAESKDLVHYIAEYVSEALADSNLAQYAKAADLEAAVGRIKTVEDNITDTASRVTTIETDLDTEKSKIAKNTSDIATLQELVGEGFEAIPSEAIKALFAE